MLLEALQKVFRRPAYILLAIGVGIPLFVLAVWFPNLSLIWGVVSSDASLADKINLPLSLLGSITSNFSALSATYTIAIVILFGLNVSLITYYVRVQKQKLNEAGTKASTFGLITGAVGMGCAACGSIILNSVIGTAAGASLISFLPLRGGEFGILGVVLMGIATYSLAKQITKPYVCANH